MSTPGGCVIICGEYSKGVEWKPAPSQASSSTVWKSTFSLLYNYMDIEVYSSWMTPLKCHYHTSGFGFLLCMHLNRLSNFHGLYINQVFLNVNMFFILFFQRKEASDHYLWETIWISFVYLKIKISTCIHYVAEMAVHCTLRSKRCCIVTSSVYIKHNPSFYSKSSWLVPSKPTRAALCCSLTCWYANYGIRPFQPARSVVPLSRID